MDILRIIGFFILLLSGSTAWSFPDLPSTDHEAEIPEMVSRDYSEPLHDISECTLTIYCSSQSGRFLPATVQDYSFYSSHVTRLAAHHFTSRQDINPGFDIGDIIFPFHYFF